MKKRLFKTKAFGGYRKDQVESHIKELKRDYEEELSKKKARLNELTEENRALKQRLEELNERIEHYIEQEKLISRVLVKAEQRAALIIEEGQTKYNEEMYKIKLEQEKWREKSRAIRSELLEFNNRILDLIENFQSEINYYVGKEISDTLLSLDNEEIEQKQLKKVIA
jgi:cell division septum initiation protein DivIVA